MEKEISNDTPLMKSYRALNKNIIVSLLEQDVAFNNGIHVQEDRGKKDIVAGLVELSDRSIRLPARAMVWFPMYAATKLKLPITTDHGTIATNTYYYVNIEDIILVERVSEE